MQNKTKAHLAVLSTNLFFAANFSLIKILSPRFMGPFALNLLRVGFCVILFWALWLLGNTKGGIRKEDRWRFVLCALTGVAINQMLFIKGLTLTSTIHGSFLMLVTPILVTLFAIWLLGEKMTVLKVLGLTLGIAGSVFLVLQKETGTTAPNYLLGDILIFINAVSYAIYFILVKPLMEKYTPLHVIRWIFTLGLLMMIPFGFTQLMEVEWGAMNVEHFLFLAFIVIAGTFLAYIFNAFGIQHIGAGATGTYIYTQPVFAVIIATFLLNEQLSLEKIAAAALIFAGVYLVSKK